MASAIEIYNRALSRIGIDQFVGDPDETSKAGTLFRLWYEPCRDTCLRDFPWNFASRVIALAELDGAPPPGWQYKYAYPVDCMMARAIADASGIRSLPVSYVQTCVMPCTTFARVPEPFVVMGEGTTSPRRILCADLYQANLFYTAKIADPNQFDASFTTALEWLLASEIASPFLGAPTGPQVAATTMQQYRMAVLSAKAQTLNESGQDIRPDSPAITCR
jgi:hypothetical protein